MVTLVQLVSQSAPKTSTTPPDLYISRKLSERRIRLSNSTKFDNVVLNANFITQAHDIHKQKLTFMVYVHQNRGGCTGPIIVIHCLVLSPHWRLPSHELVSAPALRLAPLPPLPIPLLPQQRPQQPPLLELCEKSSSARSCRTCLALQSSLPHAASSPSLGPSRHQPTPAQHGGLLAASKRVVRGRSRSAAQACRTWA